MQGGIIHRTGGHIIRVTGMTNGAVFHTDAPRRIVNAPRGGGSAGLRRPAKSYVHFRQEGRIQQLNRRNSFPSTHLSCNQDAVQQRGVFGLLTKSVSACTYNRCRKLSVKGNLGVRHRFIRPHRPGRDERQLRSTARVPSGRLSILI